MKPAILPPKLRHYRPKNLVLLGVPSPLPLKKFRHWLSIHIAFPPLTHLPSCQWAGLFSSSLLFPSLSHCLHFPVYLSAQSRWHKIHWTAYNLQSINAVWLHAFEVISQLITPFRLIRNFAGKAFENSSRVDSTKLDEQPLNDFRINLQIFHKEPRIRKYVAYYERKWLILYPHVHKSIS